MITQRDGENEQQLNESSKTYRDAAWQRDEIRLALAHRYHGYATYRLAALSRWLSEQFDEVIEDGGTDSDRHFLHRVCDKILTLVNADIVTIFVCDQGKESHLEMTDSFFERKRDSKVRAYRRKAEKILMARMGKQKDKTSRETSIAYRAYDKNEPQFAREQHHKGQTFVNPTEEDFQKALEWLRTNKPQEYGDWNPKPEDKFTRESAMAFPIIIHGRKYGVIEIDGFRKHQFRYDNYVLGLQATDIVGPFLYQRQLLSRLFALSNSVMNPNKTDREKYNEICQQLSRIFLAEAAILFVPSADNWLLLDLVGQYNLGLEGRLPIRNCKLMSEEHQWKAEFRKTGKPFEQYSVKEKAVGDWDKSPAYPHRDAVKERFPEGSGVIIRVSSPAGDMIMCRLTVYYREYEPLTADWNPTVQFVSHFLVMLIMTMRGFRPLNQLLERPGMQDLLSEGMKDRHFVTRALFTLELLEEESARQVGHILSLSDAENKQDLWNSARAQLNAAYRHGKLVVVLGAGASKHYGGPNWDELLQRLLIKSFGVTTEKVRWLYMLMSGIFARFLSGKSPLVTARFLRQRYHGKPNSFEMYVRDAIYETFTLDHDNSFQPSLYKKLAKLCIRREANDPRLHSIITYNYDDFLEEALRRRQVEVAPDQKEGDWQFVSVYRRDEPYPKSKFPVFHVHGFLGRDSLAGPENRVTLSEEIYHEQYSEPYSWNNLEQLSIFEHNTCLFIGLSFDDPNLRRLMDIAAKNHAHELPSHFVVRQKREKADAAALAYALESVISRASRLESGQRRPGLSDTWVADSVAEMTNAILAVFDNTEEEMYRSLGAQSILIENHSQTPDLLERISDLVSKD